MLATTKLACATYNCPFVFVFFTTPYQHIHIHSDGVVGLAVQCVVCASCQGLRGWLKVSGLSEAPPPDAAAPECPVVLRLSENTMISSRITQVSVLSHKGRFVLFTKGGVTRVSPSGRCWCWWCLGCGDLEGGGVGGGHTMSAACCLDCGRCFKSVGSSGKSSGQQGEELCAKTIGGMRCVLNNVSAGRPRGLLARHFLPC